MSRHDLIESGRRLAAILCSVAGTTPTNVFARDPPAQRGRRPHFGRSPDLELKIDDLLQKPLYPALNLPFKTTSTPPVVMTNRLPRIYRSRPCTDTLQTAAQEYRKNKAPLHVPPRAGVSPHRASCLGHCRSCHPILGGHTRARSPSLPRRNVGTPGSPGVVDAGWTGLACWLGHSWDHSVRVRAHTGNPCTRDLETTTALAVCCRITGASGLEYIFARKYPLPL